MMQILLAYSLSIAFTYQHRTLYNKTFYGLIVILIGGTIALFFRKIKYKKCFYVIIVIMCLIIPGGVWFNEAFTRFNMHKYSATVKERRKIFRPGNVIGKNKRPSHEDYWIYIEGDNLPFTTYECIDFKEYELYSEGQPIVIESYTGILGLPAVEIKRE